MRTRFAIVAALSAAGCGGSDSESRVNADVTETTDATCVVSVPEATRAPRVWTVRPGETLALIAQREYGDAKLWTSIRDANRELVGASDRIRPGMRLVIPFDGL